VTSIGKINVFEVYDDLKNVKEILTKKKIQGFLKKT